MKRRFLNVLLILILIGTMFILTGCGTDDNNTEETNNSEVKNSEEIENNQTMTSDDNIATATGAVTSDNYGDTVEYSAGGVDDWKIFYSDGTYVYIITSDYLDTSLVPTSANANTYGTYNISWKDNFGTTTLENAQSRFLYSSINNMTATNDSYKVAATLLDSAVWNAFVNENCAEYAIGTPSVEMWVASWNTKYTELYIKANETGYYIGSSENVSSSEKVRKLCGWCFKV